MNMRVEVPTVVVPVVEREPEVVRLLRRARARLTPETWGKGEEVYKWVRYLHAQGYGLALSPRSKFCAFTAFWLGLNEREPLTTAARMALNAARGDEDVPEWNDAPERTLADVHALYDRAIELALCASAA